MTTEPSRRLSLLLSERGDCSPPGRRWPSPMRIFGKDYERE